MSNNKPWLKKQEAPREIEVMGAKIKLKNLSFGEARKAISGGVQLGKDGKPNIDVTTLQAMRAVAAIADWELTDENDNKLPITIETLDSLDEGFASELVKAVTEHVEDGELSKEEKKVIEKAVKDSIDGKKLDHKPQALTVYELCKEFHCLPSQLDEEDNKTIQEMIAVMSAMREQEQKESRKQKRDKLKQEKGASQRR
ncbi:tail assembly chaperone [Bacillus phage 056SW001B]|uniref:Tail assembly chaperone n=4 Tax=Gettysburgvirus TaxID=3425034 RepID=A0A7T7ZAP7_9CAUD|nr:tail assembly chaperone [Bacillus phage 276BB001]QFG05948.1 tail assembly chaperone [Bacillus phage 280BB001]QFR56492.1 tail assembly chaperone [Bacillus phage 056SW001B]QQO40372.1 tail assembly chaperone [Bacillus phage 268TH004]QZA70097.1 tail assembly chaperone [Bacillus phage 274BB002]